MDQVISSLLSKVEKDIREFIKDLFFVIISEGSVLYFDYYDVMYVFVNMKYVEILDKFYCDYKCDDKDVIYELDGLVKMILCKVFLG